MKFEKGFVRSKVARRILVGFISCAILPVSGLALISFGQVEKRLLEQSERELRLTSKAVGLAIVERLSFLEAEMEIWAEKVRTGSSESVPFPGSFEHKLDRFSSLSLVTETGAIRPLTGPVESVPELSPAQQRHIDSGRATVTTRLRDGGGPAWLFMHRAVEAGNPGWGTLVGEINPSYLWGEEFSPSYSPIVGLGVLDSHRNVIFCSLSVDGAGEEEIANEVFSAVQGEFEWALEGRDYLATYWSIPLEYALLVPEWKVTLFKPRDEVFAPMATFKSTLVLFFVLTVLVVMLLSSVQIRKCLVPLVRLKEGTVRVAAREFHSRIDVKSGDEFEELADSFNAMASQLSKQFDTLTTMAEIDRKILSVLDTGICATTAIGLIPTTTRKPNARSR